MDTEDAEIKVPDSMYFVTTPCATCGKQFYVMTLDPNWTQEYTCPDCKTLTLDTKTGTASFESDAPSL